MISCSSEEGQIEAPSTIEASEDTLVNVTAEEKPKFSAQGILKDPNLEEFEFKGSVESSYSWQDENGQNILINSIARTEVDGLPAANLYSYHYIKNGAGEVELLRLVQDYEDVCDFDITMEFLGEPSITDLNNDNYAEVAIAYRKMCRSDVSECEMKVIMHDQKDKFGLRGFQYIVFPDAEVETDYEYDLSKVNSSDDTPEWLDFRGRYKNAADFTSADPSYLETADSIWRANVFERFD